MKKKARSQEAIDIPLGTGEASAMCVKAGKGDACDAAN